MFFNVQSLPFLFEIAYLVYHKLLGLSIPFLKFFRFFSISSLLLSRLSDNLFSISYLFRFVNTFLQVFLTFFEAFFDWLKILFSAASFNAICLIPSQLPLSRTARLVYHISTPFVKPLFPLLVSLYKKFLQIWRTDGHFRLSFIIFIIFLHRSHTNTLCPKNYWISTILLYVTYI